MAPMDLAYAILPTPLWRLMCLAHHHRKLSSKPCHLRKVWFGQACLCDKWILRTRHMHCAHDLTPAGHGRGSATSFEGSCLSGATLCGRHVLCTMKIISLFSSPLPKKALQVALVQSTHTGPAIGVTISGPCVGWVGPFWLYFGPQEQTLAPCCFFTAFRTMPVIWEIGPNQPQHHPVLKTPPPRAKHGAIDVSDLDRNASMANGKVIVLHQKGKMHSFTNSLPQATHTRDSLCPQILYVMAPPPPFGKQHTLSDDNGEGVTKGVGCHPKPVAPIGLSPRAFFLSFTPFNP